MVVDCEMKIWTMKRDRPGVIREHKSKCDQNLGDRSVARPGTADTGKDSTSGSPDPAVNGAQLEFLCTVCCSLFCMLRGFLLSFFRGINAISRICQFLLRNPVCKSCGVHTCFYRDGGSFYVTGCFWAS